jgi:hypothetical protein
MRVCLAIACKVRGCIKLAPTRDTVTGTCIRANSELPVSPDEAAVPWVFLAAAAHFLVSIEQVSARIQGDCPQPIDTDYERGPRQCVLHVMQSFLATPDGADLKLANLYITAELADLPTQRQSRTTTYQRHIRVRKSRLWMEDVTLEGADDVLVEGVDVLGTASAPSLIFAQGMLQVANLCKTTCDTWVEPGSPCYFFRPH